eukprot:TRINITY_DN27036_c0_g1_i1.p1 TRINITY_DN27036_c0_g1~~TRINITY_DN27036_c0_g1_i1.p1  ORF type:complete len:122 (-),score=27.15 TRINITY_DN27036_c0_g1_i1:133-498(-)
MLCLPAKRPLLDRVVCQLSIPLSSELDLVGLSQVSPCSWAHLQQLVDQQCRSRSYIERLDKSCHGDVNDEGGCLEQLLTDPVVFGPKHHCHLLLSLIHISEPTRLLSISYAVFCLKKKKKK